MPRGDKGDATRTRAKPPRDWKERFLAEFEERLTVTDACRAVGVSRKTAYLERQKDEGFATAWADVEERTTEQMEREAYRRAVEGWVEREIVDSDGNVVGHVQKFSDTLLTFMLKARRPERYRENVKIEHSGPEGGPIETRELIGGKDPAALSPATRRVIAAALAKEADAHAGDTDSAGDET